VKIFGYTRHDPPLLTEADVDTMKILHAKARNETEFKVSKRLEQAAKKARKK